MLNAGFQYLEQRDANDTITKDGVVGKNSPFATSDNSGIYDIIAEDLRWLKDNVDDVKDLSELKSIKQSVTDMYNEMKNDSSFGEAAAKAQAEEAKKQAQAALESATNAKTYRDDVVTKSTEANDTLAEIKTYIDKAEKLVESNKELEQSFSDYLTMASNKAKIASDSATNATTSETNAAASEAAAKTSETNAKTSETNAAQSESNAKAHMDATALSETNAKTSETHAKTSETNSKTSEVNAKASETKAKTSETNALNSADLAKKWAESKNSPDTMNDTDSTTGKTQSSKSWAIYSKDRAISAFKSETNAKASETAAKTSETNAKTSETNASSSASNAATSESHTKISETNAAASASAAKTSEDNASTSKSNAAASETNAKSYMDTAKEYMQKAQEALAAAQAIQSIVDTAKANAEKCLADVEAVKESLAKMITYQGSVDNYSDLPTSPQVGCSYNVKNADKTHGVNAGDNLVWNGEDWDNFGGAIDMSLFAELGKDARFNTVTATSFTGDLDGIAAKATADKYGADIADNYIKHYINVSTQDLNDVRVGGLYAQSLNANATTARHYPENEAGSLLVLNNGANGVDGCTQVYTTFSSHNSYKREYDAASKAWSAWRKYAFEDSTVACATKLATPRTISLTGNATGAATFDGSGDVSISTTVNDSKHAAAADTLKSSAATETSTVARPVWLSWEGDNTKQTVSSNLTYTCSTKTLKAANFKGHLAGNADSATNADTVDGVHAGSMFYNKGNWAADNWATMGAYQVNNVSITGGAYGWGQVISSSTNDARFQLYATHQYGGDGRLHYRTGWDSDKTQPWNTILDSENYNKFVPTKTGTGASGTWGINISGNAAGLSGDLAFPNIGDVATSRKITWGGSTDGADIYYQTTASDQGNLVLNLRDDANCYLRIAANGAFKSYFSPSDGNFHGNVNGNADTATKATTALNVPTSDVGGNIWIS